MSQFVSNCIKLSHFVQIKNGPTYIYGGTFFFKKSCFLM